MSDRSSAGSLILNRAVLRRVMDRLFPTSEELDAFCLDHFSGVHHQFSNGMTRTARVNLLFEKVSDPEILSALYIQFGRERVEAAVQETSEPAAVREDSRINAHRVRIKTLQVQIAELYEQRASKRLLGLTTVDIDAEILARKREKRELDPKLQVGDFLSDRYRLKEVVGRGGFGTVWQAYDQDTQQIVAVKVLNHEDHLRRFDRGARALAGLSHPHLVRVLKGPSTDDPFHYFVMEYLPGGDLHAAVVKKRIDTKKALRAVLQAGEALEYAHSQRLFHRDVKPQNILLTLDFSARLTDFDLVRADDSDGGTKTDALLGTHLYAAPEGQSEGDARVDVYSLGITTLFVLKGGPLTQYDLYRHSEFIDELKCTEAVREVLRKAVSIFPSKRPSSVAEFCALLQRALSSPPPVPSRPLKDVLEKSSVLFGGAPSVHFMQRVPVSDAAQARLTAMLAESPAPASSERLALDVVPQGEAADPPAAPPPPVVHVQAESGSTPPHPALLALGPESVGSASASSSTLDPGERVRSAKRIGTSVFLTIGLLIVVGVLLDYGASNRRLQLQPIVPSADDLAAHDLGSPALDASSVGPLRSQPPGAPGPGRPPVKPPVSSTKDRHPESAFKPDKASEPPSISKSPPDEQDRPATAEAPAIHKTEALLLLDEARPLYVDGKYAEAIELARKALKKDPVSAKLRAWRVIGEAACMDKDIVLAEEAYGNLDESGKKYVLYVCEQRGGLIWKDGFRLAPIKPEKRIPLIEGN